MQAIALDRVKMTARQLVENWYSVRKVTDDAVHDAVIEMMRRGWVTAFVPKPCDWDRLMVFVPQRNALSAIIRYVDYTGAGVVPRGLIESRTQMPVAHIGTGMRLAHIGVAITNIDGNNVFIGGTSPGMGLLSHQAHISLPKPMRVDSLISVATGKLVPRRQWNEEILLRAALAFDEFNIDVPGVLDGDMRSDVIPRWRFPSSAAGCTDADVPF